MVVTGYRGTMGCFLEARNEKVFFDEGYKVVGEGTRVNILQPLAYCITKAVGCVWTFVTW